MHGPSGSLPAKAAAQDVLRTATFGSRSDGSAELGGLGDLSIEALEARRNELEKAILDVSEEIDRLRYRAQVAIVQASLRSDRRPHRRGPRHLEREASELSAQAAVREQQRRKLEEELGRLTAVITAVLSGSVELSS